MSKFKERVHEDGDRENDFTEDEFSGQSERRQITPSDPKAIFDEPQHTPKTWMPGNYRSPGRYKTLSVSSHRLDRNNLNPKLHFERHVHAKECRWKIQSVRMKKSGPGNSFTAKNFCIQFEGPENTPSDPKALLHEPQCTPKTSMSGASS